jgi:serine/threonine protein kinase
MQRDGLSVGQVVDGRYRIEEEIGRGGMAVVYRVTQVVTGATFALKAMLGALSLNGEMRERFRREAQAACMIDHPNVVRVVDVAVLENGVPYLVMELLTGESLTSTAQRRDLGLHERIQLMLPILRGVQSLHEVGIVHRDIKATNVFIMKSADGRVAGVKLLDLGIAKVTGAAQLTRTGRTMGTLMYMSPEQYRDTKVATTRSDVFSCGVLVYRIVSGRFPYRDKSEGSVAIAAATGDLVPLSEHVPLVSSMLETVIHQAMRPKPEERYRDAGAFADALEPFANEALAYQSGEAPVLADFTAGDSEATPPRHVASTSSLGLAVTTPMPPRALPEAVSPVFDATKFSPLSYPPAPLETAESPASGDARASSGEGPRGASESPSTRSNIVRNGAVAGLLVAVIALAAYAVYALVSGG